MEAIIKMNDIWRMLKPLSLDNRRWLVDKLLDSINTDEEAETISKEEILAGIDAGLKDLKAGRTRPANELLLELKNGL